MQACYICVGFGATDRGRAGKDEDSCCCKDVHCHHQVWLLLKPTLLSTGVDVKACFLLSSGMEISLFVLIDELHSIIAVENGMQMFLLFKLEGGI